MRKEVKWFAEIMEEKLALNDDKNHWSTCSFYYLLERLDEEFGELKYSLYDWELFKGKGAIQECADVANFAMMIADKVKKEESK